MSEVWRTEPRPHEVFGSLDFVPTLPNAIRRAADLFGEETFMIAGERKLSFTDVDRQSADLACGLLAMGIAKGTRIGLMMPNGPDWVLAWFAAARIGALPIGMSTLFQRREIDWALRHNDVDTLLVTDRFGSANYQARLEDVIPSLSRLSAEKPFFLADAPYFRRIVVWGDEPRRWAMRGPDAILASRVGAPDVDHEFIRQLEASVTPADDLVVICTSGTTSEPKAVVHTHGSAVRNSWATTPYTLFQRGERIYAGLPFFWVGGLIRGLLPALHVGACMCFPRSLSADDLLDMVLRDHVARIYTGAAQLHAIRSAAERRNADLSAVRDGGTAFQRPGGALGMTETFGQHSAEAEDRPAPPGKASNYGRPMPGVERRIVEPETGRVLQPGEQGELQVRGNTLMRGYYKREREEVFSSDGFFNTGDMCSIDEDNFLYFFGRNDEMIKSSGANVSPREVEVVLMSFAGVREAIVLGIPDKAKGQIIVAVVVPEDDAQLDEREIIRKVRAEISSYKAPEIVVTMTYDEVPRTDAAGKPQKKVLSDMISRMIQ
jgi:acyl-CoA synthetase (AMP-forming)/AMP-acid ligase II